MRLPVNATLIDKKPVSNSEFLSIVICKVNKAKDLTEFVTWLYNHDFEGCVQGHYFDNLQDAVNDFVDRD